MKRQTKERKEAVGGGGIKKEVVTGRQTDTHRETETHTGE